MEPFEQKVDIEVNDIQKAIKKNIATPEDISNFNQEYDVNLTLPTGA